MEVVQEMRKKYTTNKNKAAASTSRQSQHQENQGKIKTVSQNGAMFGFVNYLPSMEEDIDSLNRHKAELLKLHNARVHRDEALLNTLVDLTLPLRRFSLIIEKPPATPSQLLNDYPMLKSKEGILEEYRRIANYTLPARVAEYLGTYHQAVRFLIEKRKKFSDLSNIVTPVVWTREPDTPFGKKAMNAIAGFLGIFALLKIRPFYVIGSTFSQSTDDSPVFIRYASQDGDVINCHVYYLYVDGDEICQCDNLEEAITLYLASLNRELNLTLGRFTIKV